MAWMSRRDVREWYGYAFGLPDRHPTTSVVVRFDAHHRQPGFLCWFRVRVVARGGLRTGQWTRARETERTFLFAYRDFAKLFN